MKRAVPAIVAGLTLIAHPQGNAFTSGSQTETPSSIQSQERTEKNRHYARWNLAEDIRTTGNQIGFNQGAGGVWYFMTSAGVTHNPLIYRFIRHFNAPALAFGGGITIPEGFSCWQEADVLPDVCFNFTDHPVTLESFDVPPQTVDMHPTPDGFSIVAWKSPLTGIVGIRGSFTDLDPNCGNGVLWSIDKNARTLLSGDLYNGASQRFSPRVRVDQDDVLYFIVDAKNSDFCGDSTSLDVTIYQRQ
jgi:hypothetical protein